MKNTYSYHVVRGECSPTPVTLKQIEILQQSTTVKTKVLPLPKDSDYL